MESQVTAKPITTLAPQILFYMLPLSLTLCFIVLKKYTIMILRISVGRQQDWLHVFRSSFNRNSSFILIKILCTQINSFYLLFLTGSPNWSKYLVYFLIKIKWLFLRVCKSLVLKCMLVKTKQWFNHKIFQAQQTRVSKWCYLSYQQYVSTPPAATWKDGLEKT